MSSFNFRSSLPDHWTLPRSYQDASLRFMKHGPIRPMTRPSLIVRILGRG